ncbi:MAG: phosphopyruvate hydratase, partial [Isosphaeraceae bacterium]
MPQITQIKAREVLDSRGRPTVEVEMQSACGCTGSAIAPSGASTGVHEAVELRDGDPAWYGGLGVQQAVSNVNCIISPLLAGKDPVEQSSIDEFMINADGTPNKSSLGANAILATSMAAAVLAAKTQKIELYEHLFHLNRQRNPRAELKLPLPMVNMISGGLHAGRNLEFQDFLIYPEGCHSYRESLERIVKIYRSLAKVLASYGETHALVGDEGGYGPSLNSNETALQRIVEATEKAGLKPGNDVSIALDVASSHFYDQTTSLYSIKELDGTPQPAEAMIAFLERLVENYPIVSIEDGLAEDDLPGWQKLTSRL